MRDSCESRVPVVARMDMELNRYLLSASPPVSEFMGYMINNCIGEMLPDRRRQGVGDSTDNSEMLDDEGLTLDDVDSQDDVVKTSLVSPDGDGESTDCTLAERFATLDLNLCVGSPRASDILDLPSPDPRPSSGTVNLTVTGQADPAPTSDRSKKPRTLKKKVSFADEMGDRLATYCFIPRIGATEYVYDDPYFLLSSFNAPRTSYSSPFTSSLFGMTSLNVTSPQPLPDLTQPRVETVHTICSLGFDQPSSNFASFLTRLDGNTVCLENAKVEDSNVLCTVRVKNLTFEKNVTARVTYDNWRTSHDVEARYVPSGLSVPLYDTFAFQIDSPAPHTLQTRGPRTAEFAICYRYGDQERWDNNRGANYKIMWMPRQRYSRPA